MIEDASAIADSSDTAVADARAAASDASRRSKTARVLIAAELVVYVAAFVAFLTIIERAFGRWGSVTGFASGPVSLVIGVLLAAAARRWRDSPDARRAWATGPALLFAVLFLANGAGYLASFVWRTVDIELWASAHPYAPIGVAVWVGGALVAVRFERSIATAVGLLGALGAGAYVMQTWLPLVTTPTSHG
jgi:hypothetical protein